MTQRFLIFFLLSTWLGASSCSLFNTKEEIETDPAKVALPKSQISKKLWVPLFINKTKHGNQLGEKASEQVRHSLSHLSDIIVVDEATFGETPPINTTTQSYDYPALFKTAKSLGISAVVLGWIENINSRQRGEDVGIFRARVDTVTATVSLQLVDAATEKELFFKQVSADVEEEHTEIFSTRTPSFEDSASGLAAVQKAVDKALESFPEYTKRIAWRGRIAKVEVPRYYINAGESSGLRRGQFLKVFDSDEPIYEPETGELIGTAPGRLKGVLRIVDLLGKDGAIATAHSGGDFRQHDILEIFVPKNY